MGKSLDFVRDRIQNDMCFDMNADNFKNAIEISFDEFVGTLQKELQDVYKHNEFKTMLDGDYDGIKGEMSVLIKHVPSAEFEYFTIKSCICDGTMLFAKQLMGDIFNSLIGAQTYNNKTITDDVLKNIWNYNIVYTVGDFVFNTENGDFATKDKPWMQRKFSMMLPLKCEWVKK